MPKKKTKKKTVAKKTKSPVGLPVAIQEGSPEDVRMGAAPAIELVDRAQGLLADINEITEELADRQDRLANVKNQLRSIKFDNSKLSIEFGWNEDTETPGVRVGIFAGREFAYNEATLFELNEMLQWCKEQMGNFNEELPTS